MHLDFDDRAFVGAESADEDDKDDDGDSWPSLSKDGSAGSDRRRSRGRVAQSGPILPINDRSRRSARGVAAGAWEAGGASDYFFAGAAAGAGPGM